MRHHVLLTVSLCAAASLVCLSATANAGTFDTNGVFSFDPSAVTTQTFDDIAPSASVTVTHAGDAVQGSTYININAQQGSVNFPLVLPAKGASYVARLFGRTNRTVATISVSYPNDGGSPSFSARLYPSGTVTSDGWYEVVSNQFSIQGSRNPQVALAITASGADVDAFELVPSGTFKALASCAPPVSSACGVHEFCGAGWCHDGNTFVPPLPPANERDDVLAYFRGRMTNIFGGRFSRLNYLPNALAMIDSLHGAPDAWTYWDGIFTAVRRLHDWHTQVFGPVSISGRGAMPVCFVEGNADISHAIVPKDPNYFDVLVSHTGPSGTILKPGDRLVAVNGMHPVAFADSLEALDSGMWHSDDPDGHAEAIERMPSLIRRWATNITVIQCTAGVCGAPKTIAVTDLPVDDGSYTYPYCDHRPLYHLGLNGPNAVTHDSYDGPFFGVASESGAGENIYNMVWDDVYLDPSNQSANPYQPAYDTFQANAKAVILDHRLGNGGDVNGATYLTSLFRAPATVASWAGFNLTLGEFDNYTTSFGLSLYSDSLPTGGYLVGSSTARTNLPVALLLARDGSASDWFPRGMTGGGANIRIFGRHTAGAFSSYFLFDYFSGMSWRFASGDLINPDGTTNLGTGVQPDEEIVPSQSDLGAGRDTVYLRALDWVRTCTTCRL